MRYSGFPEERGRGNGMIVREIGCSERKNSISRCFSKRASAHIVKFLLFGCQSEASADINSPLPVGIMITEKFQKFSCFVHFFLLVFDAPSVLAGRLFAGDSAPARVLKNYQLPILVIMEGSARVLPNYLFIFTQGD